MPSPRYALPLLFALAIAPSVRGQSSLAPEPGLLVLTNGSVLAGDVTRAGDRYIVVQGETSELSIPVSDVEAFCGSLDEAYEFKLRHLAGQGVKPHLKLADWCLRQGLLIRCSEQLTAATRLDPADKGIADIELRLQMAAESGPPRGASVSQASSNLTAEQLERAARELTPSSVEKFGAIVQPILLNRCGATNQCHGPNSKAEFRLLRPPAGQQASRRITLRNLVAAQGQLDRVNPAASPLLTKPQQRHGPALTPIFDKHSQQHLAQLESWVALATGAFAANVAPAARATTTAPQTIAPPAAALSQPAATFSNGPAQATAEGVRTMRPPYESPFAPAAGSAPPRFVPRDRYDAEIFNRQYHK